MELIQRIFKISTISISGMIGVQLYWLEFAIVCFVLILFLSIIDTAVWFYIAHTKNIVSSRIGSDWLFKKCIRLFLISWWIFLTGNMAYVVWHDWLTVFISAWVMLLIAFRVLFECISLVENLAIISSTNEKNSLHFISKILLKIVWIWQKQIEKKIERFNPNK
jgi:hypothetical protein